MPYYLVYVSTAAHRMDRTELLDLLEQCRPINLASDVTGALLYRDGTFMQTLEGPRDIVRTIYDRIRADDRHHDVTLIIDGHTAERQFADWSMAFRNLTAGTGDAAPADDPVVEGLTPFMSLQGREPFGTDPTIAQRILLTFRRSLTTAG